MRPPRNAVSVASFALATLVNAASSPGYPDAYLSSFLTPALSPGSSSDGLPTALDTHCVGNGRSVACVVANVAAGSMTVTLRRADAQGKSNDIMAISQVIYTVAPNPFLVAGGGYSYNQTLDMRTASVFVTGGGGAAVARVYVTTCEDHDAPPCDTAIWSLGGSGGPFSVTVNATSVRPPTNLTYGISWNVSAFLGMCVRVGCCWEGEGARCHYALGPLCPAVRAVLRGDDGSGRVS